MSARWMIDDEWLDWYRLTPAERGSETQKLWSFYLAVGGSLDTEPDSQSPFDTQFAQRSALLMGEQACVLYGGAEFSRDTDIALLASDENLALLRAALRELDARRIALPPFELQYLTRGHAIHFRSYHPEAMKRRIDVMSVMRGVDPFEQLWERRARLVGSEEEAFDVLSLPDLVRAKKTQRVKIRSTKSEILNKFE